MSRDPTDPSLQVRCRACTTNDRAALIDSVAADMWEVRRHQHEAPPFPDCGPYWQTVFRELAETAINSVRS